MGTSIDYRPSKADRVGIWAFMLIGISIILWSAFAMGARIMHVLLGEDVPVTAHLLGLESHAPIGPGGATIPLQIETATVTTRQLSTAAFGTAIAEQIVLFLTIATVVVCLILLARNTLRGQIFGRVNTALVVTAGLTAIIGFGVTPMLSSIVANDTLARISDGDFTDHAVFVAEPMPLVLTAFVVAIVATAYSIGARMQRDQEGLI